MGFLQVSVVVIFIFERSQYQRVSFTCVFNFCFCFVLFSNFFFGKMYLKWSSFIFPFLFYQLRVNDKTKIERKKGYSFLLSNRCSSPQVNIGEKEIFYFYFYFLQRLITRKAYQKNFYKTVIIHHLKVKRVSKTDTLYLKLFSIQDICCIRQFTPVVQQFFFFISEISLPRKTFFFIFSNYKSLELNLKK